MFEDGLDYQLHTNVTRAINQLEMDIFALQTCLPYHAVIRKLVLFFFILGVGRIQSAPRPEPVFNILYQKMLH